MNRPVMDIKALVGLLAARIDHLARELLPAGKRQGAEWRVGSVAGEPGQSLGVHLHGERAGVWKDFASADPRHQGDALDLVAMVLFGGDKVAALRWARGWLGLEAMDPRAFRHQQAQRPAERPGLERDAEGKRQKAMALFLGGTPLTGSDPASRYLAGRGLALERFARAPRALRFHQQVWCQEVAAQLPAMLAAVTCRGRHVATHRTYLAELRGAWTKAPLATAKKVLGGYAGGVIPLWRGASGKAIAEAGEDDQVAIAEGIEDALTVALHQPAWRALACVSLSNMAAVVLPPACLDVILCFDRDGENPQARAARERAVRSLMGQGRSVREVRPPEGFKDFNAWHQASEQHQPQHQQQDRGVA